MKAEQFIHTGDFGRNVAYGLQCLLPDHELYCSSWHNDLVDSVMSKDSDGWQIFLPNCIAEFEDSGNEQFASFYLVLHSEDCEDKEPIEYYNAEELAAKIEELEA